MANAMHFIAPLGDLRQDMFPGEDLSARVDGYLQEAGTMVGNLAAADQPLAVVAWVYYRGFTAYHSALLANPQKVTLKDQGVAEYTDKQLEAILAKAQGYLDEFNGYQPLPVTDPSTLPIGTQSVESKFTY